MGVLLFPKKSRCEEGGRDMSEEKSVRWENAGWYDKRQCYILLYYEGGVSRAYMLAYPDHRRNCFRVYPYKLAPCGLEFPKVKEVDFRQVRDA